MKKPVLVILALLVLAFISIYFIIPQNIKTTHVIEIDATDTQVSKFLVNKKLWAKWWPGQVNPKDSSLYTFKDASYTLLQSTNSEMKAIIKKDNIEQSSQVFYGTTGEGMCEVSWLNEMQSSINPFTRITAYIKIKKQAKDIDALLARFKKFMQTDTNIYGINVKLARVKYGVVLASTKQVRAFPTPKAVYVVANALKKEIAAQNALTLDSPMLNVHALEDGGYQVMVALPVNKIIKPGAQSAINKLVKGANILETQVTGGPNTVLNAFAQLKNYQKAHHLISPAMPYEVLITNRVAQPDTSKWVTQIYWPIF
ncbi:hypothetical protein [Mucilaginibacter phyllosphaerae]